MDLKKKPTLAVALAVLWAGLAVGQWRLLEEPVRVPLTNVTGPASSGQRAEAKGTGLRVHLDRLTSAGVRREATFTAPRNIFALPSSDGTHSLSNDGMSMSQQDPASGDPGLEQGEAEGSGQYRYLGFLSVGKDRQKNREMAVLSKDDEVLVLKVGDRVDEHLVLKAITAESVTMHDTSTREDQTVGLSKESTIQE